MQRGSRRIEDRLQLLGEVTGPVSNGEARVDVRDNGAEGSLDRLLEVRNSIEFHLLAAIEQRSREECVLQVSYQRCSELVALLPLLRKRVLRVGGAVFREALVAGDLDKRLVAFEARLQILGRCRHPPDPPPFRAGGLVLSPDFVDSLLTPRSQRPDEVHLQLRASFDSLAVQVDAVRERDLRGAMGDREVRELSFRDQVVLGHLLGCPANGGDADALWPSWPHHLLDGLLDGALALVQELPLAGGLVARDVAGLLKLVECLFNLRAKRRNLGGEVAHEQLGESLGHARHPGDLLQQPEHLEHARGLDGRAWDTLVGLVDRADAGRAQVLLR